MKVCSRLEGECINCERLKSPSESRLARDHFAEFSARKSNLGVRFLSHVEEQDAIGPVSLALFRAVRQHCPYVAPFARATASSSIWGVVSERAKTGGVGGPGYVPWPSLSVPPVSLKDASSWCARCQRCKSAQRRLWTDHDMCVPQKSTATRFRLCGVPPIVAFPFIYVGWLDPMFHSSRPNDESRQPRK